MKLRDGNVRRCNLRKVLFVPNLAYNLLSVSKAAEAGKTTQFDECGCQILTDDGKVIAVAKRVGNLYYLECEESECTSEEQREALAPPVWASWTAESDKTGEGWPHQMFRLRLLNACWFLRNLYWR